MQDGSHALTMRGVALKEGISSLIDEWGIKGLLDKVIMAIERAIGEEEHIITLEKVEDAEVDGWVELCIRVKLRSEDVSDAWDRLCQALESVREEVSEEEKALLDEKIALCVEAL